MTGKCIDNFNEYMCVLYQKYFNLEISCHFCIGDAMNIDGEERPFSSMYHFTDLKDDKEKRLKAINKTSIEALFLSPS